MQKAILIAAAMLALCSCTKKEVEMLGAQRAEIVFDTPVIAPNTKAIVEGTTFPTDMSFEIWSQKSDGQFTGFDRSKEWFFCRLTATYDAAAKSWRTADDYFWPEDGGTLSFIAMAPPFSEWSANISSGSFASTTIPRGINYRVVGLNMNDISDPLDLLFSERVVNQTRNGGQYGVGDYGVQLPFHHSLSQIVISAKLAKALPAEGDYIRIKSAYLKSFCTTGEFSQNIAPTEVGIGHPAWTGIIEPSDIGNMVKSEPVSLSLEANTEGFYPCIVIPQSFSEDMAIEIVYDKCVNGVETLDISKSVKVGDMLYNGSETTEYEIGKKYVYNLIFTDGQIFFAPVISDWEDVG